MKQLRYSTSVMYIINTTDVLNNTQKPKKESILKINSSDTAAENNRGLERKIKKAKVKWWQII